MTTVVQGAIEFTIVERGEDRVVGSMTVGPGMLNPHGVVHAGRRVSVVRTTVTGTSGRIVADVTTTHVPAA